MIFTFQHLTLCPHILSAHHVARLWTVSRSNPGKGRFGKCLAGSDDGKGRLHVPGCVCFPSLLVCARDGEALCAWIGGRRCLTSPPPPMASFFGLRSRGLRGCVASPPPVVSNRRFWSRDVPASRFPLAPPQRPGSAVPHGERESRCAALFSWSTRAHELLLLRLVGWQCWMPSRPGWKPC